MKQTDSDRDLANQHLKRLVQNLIALASSPEEKIRIVGYGCVGDEIAIDFESSFTRCRDLYLKEDLLNENQLMKLDELDQLLESLSGDDDDGFWTNPEKLTDANWDKIRDLAKLCLDAFGKSDSKLSVTHDIDSSGTLLIQKTITETIETDEAIS